MLYPVGVVEAERHPDQFPAEGGIQAQPRSDSLHDVVEAGLSTGRGGWIVDDHRAEMPGRPRTLTEQERVVHPAQLLQGHRRLSYFGLRMPKSISRTLRMGVMSARPSHDGFATWPSSGRAQSTHGPQSLRVILAGKSGSPLAQTS